PVYSRPSDCECKLITTFYKIYKVSRRTDISFGTYLRLTQQINMADADLTQLLNMCNNKNGSVTTCTWLSKPIYLPPAMQCNSGTTCASCTLVSSIYTSYLAQYPGKTPAISTVDDTVQTQKNVLFQNYMNNRLGFTKQAWEYLQFMDTCAAHAGSISDTVQCLAHSLGNAFKAGTTARFTDVHASTTGGYIMAGSTIPTGLSVRDAYIVNVDDTGAVKWAKTWGGTGDDYFNRVRQTSDNGYIAIGTTRSAQYSNGEIFIVKTDVNGNTRWKRVLG
ncbi:MAG: hypothetical protein ABUL46_02590, partial [Chitinophaga rupis]